MHVDLQRPLSFTQHNQPHHPEPTYIIATQQTDNNKCKHSQENPSRNLCLHTKQHYHYLHCFNKYFKHIDFTQTNNTITNNSSLQTSYKPLVIALKELPRKKQQPSNLTVMLKTEYSIITTLAHRYFNFKFFNREDHFDDNYLIWMDSYVTEEFVKRLKSYQKINHFPNSCELGRKDLLSANLKLARSLMPQQYTFYPKTWVFPNDCDLFFSQREKEKFFIVKPHANCQGRGIYITKNPSLSRKDEVIVQQYVDRPMLIEGHKFDLRIYVLLRSLSPLRIYVYREGLCRLATNKYVRPDDKNILDQKMHLTNYAINKNAPNFVPNKEACRESEGHKRSYSSVLKQIERKGLNSKQIEERIESVIIRTIMASYTKMLHSYKKSREQNVRYGHNKQPQSKDEVYNKVGDFNAEEPSVCFELLGFDIMLMESGEPVLIEINHQPSLVTDSPFDLTLKKCLLIDTINLLSIEEQDKQIWEKCQSEGTVYKDQRLEQKELENMGGYKRVYPVTACEQERWNSERIEAKKLVYQTILNKFLFNEYKKLHKIKLANYKTISYRPSTKKQLKKNQETAISKQKATSTSAEKQREVALTFFNLFNESKFHIKRHVFRKPRSIDYDQSDSKIKNHVGQNTEAQDQLVLRKNLTLQKKVREKEEQNVSLNVEKNSFNLQKVYLKKTVLSNHEQKCLQNLHMKNRGIVHYVSAESKRTKNNAKIMTRLMDKLNPEAQIKQVLLEKEKEQKQKTTLIHIIPTVNRNYEREIENGERTSYLRQKYGVSIRQKLQMIQNIKTIKSEIKKFNFNNFLSHSHSKNIETGLKVKQGISNQKTTPSSG